MTGPSPGPRPSRGTHAGLAPGSIGTAALTAAEVGGLLEPAGVGSGRPPERLLASVLDPVHRPRRSR